MSYEETIDPPRELLFGQYSTPALAVAILSGHATICWCLWPSPYFGSGRLAVCPLALLLLGNLHILDCCSLGTYLSWNCTTTHLHVTLKHLPYVLYTRRTFALLLPDGLPVRRLHFCSLVK